jgi:hypothetical protein
MTADNENQEINTPSDDRPQAARARYTPWDGGDFLEVSEEYEDFKNHEGSLVQWTTPDNRRFVPAGQSQGRLPPAVYDIQYTPQAGIYFERVPQTTEHLIRFPHSNSERVLREVQAFWDKEGLFRDYRLSFKRGILLYGPSGAGKSCTIRLILQDLVERSGLAFRFTAPPLFRAAVRSFREVEPSRAIVVIIEDIDTAVATYGETDLLDVLDGAGHVNKAVFLATTNYPEHLSARILNRPSRFDKHFRIDLPDAEARRMYLQHLTTETKGAQLKIDQDQWVQDTDHFSLAHLKELFIAVAVLGDDYQQAIVTLRAMKEAIGSDDEQDHPIGFAAYRRRLAPHP